MTLHLTEKATKYLSLLREDRIEEALEYALELLKKEAMSGSAAKYFYKATSSKNPIIIHTIPQVVETKREVVLEKEIPSQFSTLKSQVYEKKEEPMENLFSYKEVEEEKEIKISSSKGFVDLTEF